MAHHSTQTDRCSLDTTRPLPVIKLLFSQEVGLCDEQYSLGSEEFSIGRAIDPGCGLTLPRDRLASKQHAILRTQEERVELVDLKSYNQTFVNGKPVTSALLADGDILRIGGSLLLFRLESGVVPDAPPDAAALHSLLLGRAPSMAKLRHQLASAASKPDAVLLLGETGTGKERAAEALHRCSGRRGPLVTYDLGRLTPATAESALFGHERGAFTGADKRRIGLFEEASGGTLFLDEVGELPLELQPMLLRVLEGHVVRALGATKDLRVDVRVVAATNRDLKQAVASGHFRADLFARLAQIPISLPPLCERQEDILPLFVHYLGGRPNLATHLCEALLLYPWTANLRELINLTRQLKAFHEQPARWEFPMVRELLRPPPAEVAESAPVAAAVVPAGPLMQRRRVHYNQEMIERLLRQHRGVLSYVSDAIGVSRRQLTRMLKLWGLDPATFQDRKR